MTGSFQRYLEAKRTVDDRALDRRVIGTLRDQLATASGTDGPVRVLEIGAGIGTMLRRLIEWDMLPDREIQYTAVDLNPENVERIPTYLYDWADDREISVTDAPLALESQTRRIEVDPIHAEAVAYADHHDGYDLLIGAAVLDILDRDGLPVLLDALAPGGLYYFPLTFDGGTRFQPSHPADRAVERRYHEHMDQKQGGNSRAGGDVLGRLQRRADVTISAVAGSDWIVRPVEGTYPDDEAYMIGYILDTIEDAVGEITGDGFPELDGWLETRRTQLSAAELVYHTHQLDVLGSVGDRA